MTDRKSLPGLSATLVALTALLLVYSQTLSLTWDEGFHLVAAQLINAGKKPYVDFLFAQTPLNAYWNAFCMRLFGQTWHTAHALAALETAAAVALTADYLRRRFPLPEWRLTVALAAALLTGLNVVVVEYGTLGQAYGLCLFLTVLAFRFTVAARRSLPLFFLAGLASAAAASSSLLTAPVTPVLLLWILWRSRAGAAAVLAGVIVALIPMLRLFLAAPHQVIFDIVRFHLFYRQVQWEGWYVHDLDVFASALDCFHALVLGVLALAGVFALRQLPRDVRAEFTLAGWLALATGAYLMTTHPTFQRYFLLTTPFLAILAAAGIPGLLTRFSVPARSLLPVALLAFLMSAALARDIYEDRDDNWYNIEPIARKVDEVTRPGAMLYADEHVYFLTGRIPPPGLEWNGAHKVDLPMDQAAPLHLLPRAEIVRRVKAHTYATFETCGNAEPETLGLDALYRQHAEVKDCFVYWDPKP